ncbi:MAG: nucleotidyltransferase family protein [Candidatus Omnitrophica bacterium]|nr:nucleotidyltransferase family protein [Candidatus Omnitrophota bacterium]MBU2044174.1 nucleotidyltransferase family protein [Candidatus Omnitrophota bacterium]MBU2251038.1 nucleotidyltransferase family protein [Candidatus Omnitrophota bacterium]MBU2265555.1 nucleotidyltransferase family protein [Candidatus Omnitrophota bacterium]MBU2473506.1 nucleotidyltransferase family protein [Candidatus Omnitrophota bacterium]
MKVVVLAAGYGTRLYPLTRHLAKPLIPINKKPMINFLFEKIAALEKEFTVDEIRVVVNKKFYKDFLNWKKRFKIKAKILNDGSMSPDDRLGAIKDMKFAFRNTKTDWLVLGGDNLFDDNLFGFLKFAKKKSPDPSIGLYDIKSRLEAKRFGIVKLNQARRIVDFEEKPKKPASTLAASCIYFFPRQSLRLLDQFVRQNQNVDASGRYIAWLAKKAKVFGYILKGRWVDIGHFNSLKLAEKIFK